MKKRIMRCALIGLGVMRKKYALMLDSQEVKGLSLAAVVCRSDDSVQWANDHLHISDRVFRNEDELYCHSELFDAVLIVTPDKLHPQMTIRALAEGKHVMCDKPPGILYADAEKMQETAERNGLVYALMCHQRTFPAHMRVRQLLREGAVGSIRRVLLVNSMFFRTPAYHASSPWRSSWKGEGGGALINQGYHILDFCTDLFGLPETVYAMIPFGKYNAFLVDDEATVLMEYPDRMTGTFIISTGERYPVDRLEILGTEGSLILEGNHLRLTRFSQDTEGCGQQVIEEDHARETKPYHIMLENFAEAINSGTSLIASGKEGIGVLQLINAAYLSAWAEKKVTLPVDADAYTACLKQKEAEE
ncbi:MAG: Gfo/Idh/MocA family oxidoreductase [Solobacterium sp.]|nr:Gfo/Idh/MocA family oxidoreductase [Solobacterium sp.]